MEIQYIMQKQSLYNYNKMETWYHHFYASTQPELFQ